MKFAVTTQDASTQIEKTKKPVVDLISSDLGQIHDDEHEHDPTLTATTSQAINPDGKTCPCPICSKTVTHANINVHIDSGCKLYIYHASQTHQNSKKRGNGQPSVKPETRTHKPSVAYDMTKEKKLRDMLRVT